MIQNASSLAALDLIAAVTSVVIALSFVFKIRRHGTDNSAFVLAIGLALYAFGWAAHISSIAAYRSLEAMGNTHIINAPYLFSSWPAFIPLFIVIIGAGMILEPMLTRIYGRHWFINYIVTIAIIYTAVAMIL